MIDADWASEVIEIDAPFRVAIMRPTLLSRRVYIGLQVTGEIMPMKLRGYKKLFDEYFKGEIVWCQVVGEKEQRFAEFFGLRKINAPGSVITLERKV